MRLLVNIASYLRKITCDVYHAPFDVRLLKNPVGKTDRDIYTVVQPDLCMICDPAKIGLAVVAVLCHFAKPILPI